jgi:FkbM family methyltransferase
MRPAAHRKFLANGIFGGTLLVDLISTVKWAVYPYLVRFAPRLAIAIHEPESTGAYWRAIREGMLIVDGGANRGGYTILASKRAGPSGRIYAFEPEPENFKRLSRRLSRLHNVVPVQQALGRSSGEARLNLDRFHARHSLTRDGGDGRSVAVSVISLDDSFANIPCPASTWSSSISKERSWRPLREWRTSSPPRGGPSFYASCTRRSPRSSSAKRSPFMAITQSCSTPNTPGPRTTCRCTSSPFLRRASRCLAPARIRE